MIKVQINNRLDDEKMAENIFEVFRKIAREAARIEGYNNCEISIALVDDCMIKDLNQRYRNVAEPTDVLSFPIDENILGDIIISVETARRQAEQFNHSLIRELCYLVTHGILHLLGYEHDSPGDKRQMRQKEERILSKFGISRNQEESS